MYGASYQCARVAVLQSGIFMSALDSKQSGLQVATKKTAGPTGGKKYNSKALRRPSNTSRDHNRS